MCDTVYNDNNSIEVLTLKKLMQYRWYRLELQEQNDSNLYKKCTQFVICNSNTRSHCHIIVGGIKKQNNENVYK